MNMANFFRGRCLDRRTSLPTWSRLGAWIGVALFGMRLLSSADLLTQAEVSPPDARPAKLRAFFNTYRCPTPLHIEEYVRAADAFGIDYRLLPALSVRESTCGRHERANNRWGWDSARTGFDSVANGIRFIARELAWGKNYRGKTLHEKLQTYNPLPTYPAEVEKLMREIAAD
jgi:hypothetical protein